MKVFAMFILMLIHLGLSAQQDCDQSFQYKVSEGGHIFETEKTIYLDAAHHNFHLLEARYCAFGKVLRAHGLTVKSNNDKFTKKSLSKKSVMVIANAADTETAKLHEGEDPWVLPNRSAFTTKEIEVVSKWVEQGGSLMLIVDHMPFPGNASELAKAFGFTFFNGSAAIKDLDKWPSQFRKGDGTLKKHEITQGLDSVASFTGSAFWPPTEAKQIMVFGDDHEVILLERSGRPYPEDAPRFNAKGLSHAAVLEYGNGRVAVFGEAAMFTAQNSSDVGKMGLNSEKAPNNAKLLVNVMKWLLN